MTVRPVMKVKAVVVLMIVKKVMSGKAGKSAINVMQLVAVMTEKVAMPADSAAGDDTDDSEGSGDKAYVMPVMTVWSMC